MSLLKQPFTCAVSTLKQSNYKNLIEYVLQTDVMTYKKFFFRQRYIISAILEDTTAKRSIFPESGCNMMDMDEEPLKLDA